MEETYEEVTLEDYEIDPLSTEEKVIFSHDELVSLPSEEIREIVEDVLCRLTLEGEDIEFAYDVIYEAIEEALNRVNNRI